MPRRCCVPGCKGNYDTTLKKTGQHVSTFRFPKKPEQLKKWLKAMSRRDWVPTKNSAVCGIHFHDSDIVWFNKYTLPSGETKKFACKYPKLRENAVPNVNLPKYVSSDLKETRIISDKERKALIQRMENEHDYAKPWMTWDVVNKEVLEMPYERMELENYLENEEFQGAALTEETIINNENGSDTFVDTNAEIALDRIKNEHKSTKACLKSDLISKEFFEIQNDQIKLEKDLESEEFKGAAITEELIIKDENDSDTFMNANADVVSNRIKNEHISPEIYVKCGLISEEVLEMQDEKIKLAKHLDSEEFQAAVTTDELIVKDENDSDTSMNADIVSDRIKNERKSTETCAKCGLIRKEAFDIQDEKVKLEEDLESEEFKGAAMTEELIIKDEHHSDTLLNIDMVLDRIKNEHKSTETYVKCGLIRKEVLEMQDDEIKLEKDSEEYQVSAITEELILKRLDHPSKTGLHSMDKQRDISKK